ncbi:cytochrome c [Paenibacillus sp. H1-7]|uniref:c-type cytochrome n=1 Tax=Paenibacillus sp. H1-7 TaxID=2282849 RepID=UPI001EF87439|nr:cytochrome c [Paenibacillus sp. H1-7]ULL18055.1 cytochrome c [Paenibacillus sp. H1-7]
MKKWHLLLLTILFVLSMTACGGGKTATPTPSPSPSPAAGGTTGGTAGGGTVNAEAIYKQSCMACHGGNLEGKTGPSLAAVGGKLNKDQIATKISNGGGGMPAFKNQLKDTEVQGLADWLAAKK